MTRQPVPRAGRARPSPARLAAILRARHVALGGRLLLLGLAGLRALTPPPLRRRLRRLGRPLTVPLVRGRVFLSDPFADYSAFYDVFVDRCYEGEHRGAAVLDLGAHKGYAGAFFLLEGAAGVLSVEPEAHNYGLLARTAEEFRALGHLWAAEKGAVGGRDGTARLFVLDASWSHSLLRRANHALEGEEEIPLYSLGTLLAQLRALVPEARRRVVKLDVEGAECETILQAPLDVWEGVDELFLEVHSWAPCTWAELRSRLEAAGLRVVGMEKNLVRWGRG